jgi:two-component system catabolic regulation response regulator CreB
MAQILVVEDEAAIADTLIFALKGEGFEVTWVGLAGDALAQHAREPADLWILDVGLPDMNGFEACKRLRQSSDVPVIFLTARDAEVDRVVGLEIGADDYVTKPFSPREVAARVKAILKRVSGPIRPACETPALCSVGPFRLDLARCQLHFHGHPVSLTAHEFRLIQALLDQPERVFSREQLLGATGATAGAGYERTIDSHIKSLRAKLRRIVPDGEPIRTHRGLGYSLRLD